ncbi:PDZ domain-containing protein, partial [archaeon]|nr:PDZ domain-containing protein [archaeon]
MKKAKIVTIILIVAIISVGLLTSNQVYSNNNSGRLNAYIDLLREKSDNYINQSNIYVDLLKGSLGDKDKYTYFQQNEIYESEQQQYGEGVYKGIGVSMSLVPKGAYVVSVYENSPAYRAGLEAGDIIVSADGNNFSGKSLTYISSQIKGKEDTIVKLGVLKQGIGNIVYYHITRKTIELKTVSLALIDKDTAYIRISSFTNRTGEEMEILLERVDNLKIKDIILDLRNNGGGAVGGSIGVAHQLLSNKIVTKMEYKFPGYLDLRYRTPENDKDYNIVLLINRSTASASEILAAALKENEAAILVGEKTYGKSLVQASYQILSPQAYEKYSRMF